MSPVCQICFSKRKVKFHTDDIAICQWCITELSNNLTSPADLVSEKRVAAQEQREQAYKTELARLHGLRRPAPTLEESAILSTAERAEQTVKQNEGFFQFLFRSLVNESARLNEIQALSARHKADIVSTHQREVREHLQSQTRLEAEITAFQDTAANIPREVEADIKKFLSTSTASWAPKTHETRLLRAHRIGLISEDLRLIQRPVEIHYEELKKRIRARDLYRCNCCHRGFEQGELHVHHIVPLSLHGTNAESNLVTLCHPCHNKQHPDFQVTRAYPIKRQRPKTCFVVIDIETTGLSNSDVIIEIGAAKFINGKLEDVFSSLVHTSRAIPSQITRLTGITQAMIDDAPDAAFVMPRLVAFASDHRIVFHNAPFDMRFLKPQLDRYELALPGKVVDTLQIARKKLPELPSRRLSHLIEHFDLPASNSHRAKDDSIATGHLYLVLTRLNSHRKRQRTPAQHTEAIA